MKYLPLILCLFIFPSQSHPDQTVALIFRDPERIEIVMESQAQAEYDQLLAVTTRTPAQESRFVALAIALGSIPNRCTEAQDFAHLCIRLKEDK